MKRILSIICVLAILLGGGTFFKEAHSDRASELSYGIEVLQAAKAQKKGSLCGSAISFTKEDFKELFIYSENLDKITEKLALYSSMKADEDTRNSKYQQMSGNLNMFFSKIDEIFL